MKELIAPATRGDPESPLQRVTLSSAPLTDQLTAQGHRVSRMTVDPLLHQLGFSLQSNRKSREGAQHPDPRRAVPVHQRQIHRVHRLR
jgi:Rhodopirellula transposase DDE domain